MSSVINRQFEQHLENEVAMVVVFCVFFFFLFPRCDKIEQNSIREKRVFEPLVSEVSGLPCRKSARAPPP